MLHCECGFEARGAHVEGLVAQNTIPADVWQARLKTQGLSDAYVADNKIAPGGTTGCHSHPGPSLIFVVATLRENEALGYGSSISRAARASG